MSTADGAILAMGTVASHNLVRLLDGCFPNLVTPKNLLMVARISTIPFTLASTLIGAYYRSSQGASSATGYLLIVAFDIVLATVVAPLFGCFYTKNPSPRAAFVAVICGAFVRILLEFVLDKVSGLEGWRRTDVAMVSSHSFLLNSVGRISSYAV